MTFKRFLALLTAAVLAVSLAACGESQQGSGSAAVSSDTTELVIYAPTETMAIMSDLVYRYSSIAPKVTLKIMYDDGVIQTAKVEGGYPCDIFVSDEDAFMDWLDIEADEQANPNRNDKIVSETRADFANGPGNEAYLPEGVEVPEGEIYTTVYSVAVCRATGKSYEASRFVEFMLSEDVQDVYDNYGFSRLEP